MALDSIEGSLKERGVRLTRQRQILLELIDKTGEHLDAESLFQMAKEKDPKLNRVVPPWPAVPMAAWAKGAQWMPDRVRMP